MISIDVIRGSVLLEVMGVPPFVNTSINCPEIIEYSSIIGPLEHKVAHKWCLVGEIVDEEFDFIEDADMVLLVLDLEVAVSRSLIRHVNHVLIVD